MTAPVVLGVDPGAASLGLVVRHGDWLLYHSTLLRQKRWSRAEWVDACLDTVNVVFIGRCRLLALEDVNTPSPHIGNKLISPASAIETGVIAGAIAGWAWSGPVDVVWVPPGHNGQGPIDAYPEPLRPTRGQGKGADSLRHCRSAWDCAGTGALLHTGRVVA